MPDAALFSIAILLVGSLIAFLGGPRLIAGSILVIPASLMALVIAAGRQGNSWWRVDRIGLILGLSALLIGGCVIRYAQRQFAGERRAAPIIASSFLVIASVLATDLAANGAALLISWIGTSGSVLLLLWAGAGRWRGGIASKAAKTFVIFDGVLVLGAVIGLWWLGKGAQTSPFESSYALSGLGAVALLATASVAAIGRAGLTTRSSWVIGTIATPTSVSALLHAGVVNAGALLILRAQGLTGSIWWIEILTAALCFTVLVMLAPRIHARVDLKGQLATSTISQMAFMLLALSLGWPLIALTHLIGHGLYKATRFMAAGGAIEARSRRRRRAPSGNRIENHVRILGSAGIVLTASALAMTLHGDVLTAMGVLAPGAVAVWWVRTKEPILQPFMSWLLLALGLTFYGAFVAGAELFLEPSLPSGLWQAPWSVLGVITGAVSLISILRHSREPITAGSKISRIQLFLHPKLREAA